MELAWPFELLRPETRLFGLHFVFWTSFEDLFLISCRIFIISVHVYPPSDGFPCWSIPQQEVNLLTSWRCTSLPAGSGMRSGCHGDTQCWLQRFVWCFLYGGVVPLLRPVSSGVLPGCHPTLQLPAHILGQPHGHLCCPGNTHVSHNLVVFQSVNNLVVFQSVKMVMFHQTPLVLLSGSHITYQHRKRSYQRVIGTL